MRKDLPPIREYYFLVIIAFVKFLHPFSKHVHYIASVKLVDIPEAKVFPRMGIPIID